MILLSVVVGTLLGALLLLLLLLPSPAPLLLFPAAFAAFPLAKEIAAASARGVGQPLHLKPMLLCIVAGFVAVNASPRHRRLSHILHTAVRVRG